jgi:hypothetical protein
MSYVNETGTSGHYQGATVANTPSAIISHITHTGAEANKFGPFIPLQAGDAGISRVVTSQFTVAQATAAGAVNLVLCKPIASIPITTTYVAAERDLMNQLPSLPRIQDGACPVLLWFAGAATVTASQFQGYCDFAWG